MAFAFHASNFRLNLGSRYVTGFCRTAQKNTCFADLNDKFFNRLRNVEVSELFHQNSNKKYSGVFLNTYALEQLSSVESANRCITQFEFIQIVGLC